jgi:hypothetical protein
MFIGGPITTAANSTAGSFCKARIHELAEWVRIVKRLSRAAPERVRFVKGERVELAFRRIGVHSGPITTAAKRNAGSYCKARIHELAEWVRIVKRLSQAALGRFVL